MKASVIVLVWNGIEYLETCLNAVFAQDYPDFEVIVVDNGSTDGSADFVAQRFPQARLIRNERNLGYAAGNNIGLRAAVGDALVLLNQDTEVRPGWLRALVEALDDETVGIVGCKLLYPDGTIQHAGARLADVRGSPEHIGHHEPDRGQYDQPCDVEFVTGAAIGLTRFALGRVGYLDEGFAPAYYEDVDWCYRAREAGLRIIYHPDAMATHFEYSSKSQMTGYAHRLAYHQGRLRLLLKHKPLDWLEQEFAPAEAVWMGQVQPMVERLSARTAYLRAIFAVPEILPFRAQLFLAVGEEDGGSDEGERILELMVRLRGVRIAERSPRIFAQLDHIQEHAVGTRILQAAQLPPPAAESASDIQMVQEAQELPIDAPEDEDIAIEASPGAPEDLLTALHAQWQIKEHPFHSDIPFLGRFIAAFRQAWNNIATRWYVLPILQQQVQFNSTVVGLITQLAGKQNALALQLTQLAGKQNDLALQFAHLLQQQSKQAAQLMETMLDKNEIAVTQVAILNTMREMFDAQESCAQALVQSVQQDTDSVARVIIELRERLDNIEQCLSGESPEGNL